MILATGRLELERWLAAAAFNAYFGLRSRESGAVECTIEAPSRDEFERPGGAVSVKIGRQLVYAIAECASQDGTPLTHHTGIYVRIPDGRA